MNNSSQNGRSKVTVLYKIANSKADTGHDYNAFEMPFTRVVNLKDVKHHCKLLHADRYHWRVRVDGKISGGNKNPIYSWWDVQDENASLPVKDASFAEISQMFSPPKIVPSSDDYSVASSVRSLGKAMNKVVEISSPAIESGLRVPVIAFKLLDMAKVCDSQPSRVRLPTRNNNKIIQPRPAPQLNTTRSSNRSTPTNQNHNSVAPTPDPSISNKHTPASQSRARQPVQQTSLMDFGPAPTPQVKVQGLQPELVSLGPIHTPTPSNLTKAQKLKIKYEKDLKNANRVWDEIDQRWVTVDTKGASEVKGGTTSAPPSASNVASVSTVKGISIDASNAIGKSASVAAAVNARVKEMEKNKKEAVNEIREREKRKKEGEAAEDLARQKLEPKIKLWSEEHGKKKQLRALLASLHTILWSDAKWKPVNLGDLLDDGKVKRNFHKASRVVHPDKTFELSHENKFLAKRIFDALKQAKSDFDDAKN